MIRGQRFHRLMSSLVDRALLAPERGFLRRFAMRRVRNDARLADHFDRSCVALRVLEARGDDEWSSAEAALCEAAVFEQLGLAVSAPDATRTESGARSWTRGLLVAGAATLAMAALMLLTPLRQQIAGWGTLASPGSASGETPWLEGLPADGALYWGSRGRWRDAGIAIDALCGDPLRPASEGCTLREDLGLAYRIVDPQLQGASMVWFGVDAQGQVRYYQPTPIDVAPVVGRGREWTAMPFSVALWVQHEVGEVTIYALAYGGSESITVDDIDRWAAALERRRSSSAGHHFELPWHLEIGDELGLRCGDDVACASARSTMRIVPSLPTSPNVADPRRTP